MYNSFWKRILYVYFGTPTKAIIFSIFLVSQIVALGYYFYHSRLERYEVMIEQSKQEQDLLKKMVSEIREKQPLSISINFKELNFDESIEKENENQVKRLIEYGRFALTKNDYDYAKSLFQEANSIAVTNEAQYYLAIIAIQSGKYKEAIARFDKITIRADDENSNVLKFYRLLADYKLKQGD